MTRLFSFAFALSFALAAPLAHAQTGNAGVASQLFDAGRDSMKRGDYATACPKLAESARLEPRVGTLARLAECEEKIGHVASARGHWKDTVDLARAQKDDRAGHAEDEYKRVDAITPRLLIKPASTPAGFSVRVDELALGGESMNLALPIDPGHHAIVATATNKKSWTGSIDTKPDGSTSTLEIPSLEDAPATTPENPPHQPPPPQPIPEKPVVVHRPLATVGVVMLVAGAGVLALGAGLGGGAIVTRDGAGCSNQGVCPSASAGSSYDTARMLADVATVSFIAGGVLAAAGLVLFAVAPKTVTRAALHVVPGGIGGVF